MQSLGEVGQFLLQQESAGSLVKAFSHHGAMGPVRCAWTNYIYSHYYQSNVENQLFYTKSPVHTTSTGDAPNLYSSNPSILPVPSYYMPSPASLWQRYAYLHIKEPVQIAYTVQSH